MCRRERIEQAAGEVSVAVGEAPAITHTFQVLTPIFGGGAVNRKPVDADNPLRVSAIRGQLRFWWRAARGGQFSTISELRERETQLWGAGTAPGLASLRLVSEGDARSAGNQLSQHSAPRQEYYYERDHRGNWRPVRGKEALAYIGFALQPTSAEKDENVSARPAVLVTGRHELVVTLNARATCADPLETKAAIEEIEAAVWAWSRFGGIGGRTRRGFGAISAWGDCEAASALLTSPRIVDKCPPPGVPSLAPASGARIASCAPGKARAAWEALAKCYQMFRQGNGVGRNPPDPGKWAGRSRWPEPDFIRHQTSRQNSGAPAHKKRIVTVDKAPRAQFGMPVIFHFIESIDDLTLKSGNHDRYASPLILQPVGTRDKAYGVALVLGNRPDLDTLDGGVVLEQGSSAFPVGVNLTRTEAATLSAPLGADADPLFSFLDFVAAC